RDVAAGMSKVRYKSAPDWVATIGHDNGDCLGCLLSPTDREFASSNDNINLKTDELDCKVRKPIRLTFGISVIDDNVLALNPTKITQPSLECLVGRSVS